MTDFQPVETPISDSIRRDRYGRYLLPDPETGREQAWTRVTTIAGTLKDRYGLEQWDQRNIVYGIGQKEELYTLAASATLDDRDLLTKIASRAKEAASSKAGADIGSAIHTFTEGVDRGEDVTVPEAYKLDIDAYRRACDVGELEVVPDWIERVVIIPEIGAVGTLDRLCTGPWVTELPDQGLPRIGDVKTATDKVYNGRVVNTILTYSMDEIPLQLAMYAHASHWWSGNEKGWQPCPGIDLGKAMLVHVPAGLGECRIYEIDIEAGWEAVQQAVWVREWRKRKGLAQVVLSVNGSPVAHQAGRNPIEGGDQASTRPLSGKDGEASGTAPSAIDPPAPAPSSIEQKHVAGCPVGEYGAAAGRYECTCADALSDPVRLEWLRDRVEVIKFHDGARARLAQLWSKHDHIPTFKVRGPRTDEQVSVVAGLCGLVEMEFGLPFPREPDPTEPELNIKEQKAAWAAERDENEGKGADLS